MRTKISKSILFLILSLFPLGALSQSKLHLEYRFEEAISAYKSEIDAADSLGRLALEEAIIQCENGSSLLHYAVTPNVLSRKEVPAESFYLSISGIADKTWLPAPNPLLAEGAHKYYSAICFPEGATTLYYSAPDNSGSWNIYRITQLSDTLWSEPQILGESLTSAGDEIYPMLSADGKELYFASNGHYGMGGFDLYVSHWDESAQDWGAPENLGFPYSSTADDIFFMNTPDGQFSILASNRSTAGSGNLMLYALEYTPTPIKRELSDIGEIQNIAKLQVSSTRIEKRVEVKEQKPAQEGMSEYAQLVVKMRGFKVELDQNIAEQNDKRLLYERVTNEDDREFIKTLITELEAKYLTIKDQYDLAAAEVQRAEMEFLSKGIIPSFEMPQEEPQVETPQGEPSYKFAQHSHKEAVDINIMVPEPEFDYSFKILDEAQFAEDNTLPDGLVYQIQLMVTSNPAAKKVFKGMSPIFERKQPSGKYLYTVGLWRTHSEALKYLNQVRKRGFPKAYIVAYNSGKSISVKNARILEKDKAAAQGAVSYQLLLKGYPEGIPSGILTAIRGACDKDLAKSVVDGQTAYIVGPFSNKDEADKLKDLLFGLGVEGMSVEPIKK